MERKRRGTGKSTLSDVAKFVGVSSMTVSRALRDPTKVSETLVGKIQEAIKELGYVPNNAAQALASASSRLILFVTPRLASPGFQAIYHQMKQSLKKMGFHVLLAELNNKQADYDSISTFISYNPVLVIKFDIQFTNELNDYLSKSKIHLLSIGHGVNDNTDSEMMITPDFKAVFELMAYKIAHRVYRNPLLILHGEECFSQDIIRSWDRMLLAHDLSPNRVHPIYLAPSVMAGFDVLKEMQTSFTDTDLVVTSDENLAYGIWFACREMGIAVPAQLAIVCVGQLDLNQSGRSKLSGVNIRWDTLAVQAMEKVCECLELPSKLKPNSLAVEWISGESY
ncbi:LacI family DNA-binding transcriptional regulator [Vibrio porteresiae]|uniref:LacI family DNA-binding transcriptional regulator n=1 Tax=Vibrio porteresiae DSM 19223 TaxID=1123496 RepID=A0ABZ0QJ63_9VIBR|nr:LacI family DNA-binding transcriptional regulator [Vibrio porteresiae]WPC76071.1 LacI family DNA-binding transcriptional regulator [Vibrio porteresiae DSM 19223]